MAGHTVVVLGCVDCIFNDEWAFCELRCWLGVSVAEQDMDDTPIRAGGVPKWCPLKKRRSILIKFQKRKMERKDD